MLIEVKHANGHVVQDGHLNLVLFVLLADGAQLAQFHTLLGDQQHAPRGALRRARFFGAWQLVTPLALRGKAMLTEDTTLQIHDHLSMNGSTDQQKNGM